MNNSTIQHGTFATCGYCHVDLSKAELPVILILTLIFNVVALTILFKIRKKSEEINHFLVTKVAMNDLFSAVIFTVMWLGGWIKCGCMMTFTTCAIFGWLATASVIWSAWIVIVMSVCRYLATVKPIYYRTNITIQRVQIAIYATLGFSLAKLMFPFFGVAADYKYYEDNFICAYDFSPGAGRSGHREILGFLGSVGLLVSTATMVLNVSIIYELRKKNGVFGRHWTDNSNKIAAEMRNSVCNKIAFANVTIVVSAVFCICYVPFLVRLMYDVIVTNVEVQNDFYHSITMSFLFLAPLLNPVVYVVCNKRYRSQVLTFLRKLCSRRHFKRKNKINIAENNSATIATCTTSTV